MGIYKNMAEHLQLIIFFTIVLLWLNAIGWLDIK